jgi:hypothetical protein
MFTISSYSAFRRTTAPSFAEAVEAADRFAREGNLPSTIRGLGSRWTKWAGAPVELAEGPGLAVVDPTCWLYRQGAWAGRTGQDSGPPTDPQAAAVYRAGYAAGEAERAAVA